MIKSIQFKSGYQVKLKNIGEQKFNFSPGINILFGPNGSGKSTILSALAASTNCDISHFGKWHTDPYAQIDNKPDATIEWDGSPTWYYNLDNLSKQPASFECRGFLSFEQSIGRLTVKSSRGQDVVKCFGAFIKKFTEENEEVSKLRYKPRFKGDKLSKEQVAYNKFIDKATKEKPTILLDEPDTGLSFLFQYIFAKRILLNITKTTNAQIIIATHNPFLLLLPPEANANIIDVKNGYVDLVKKLLSQSQNQNIQDIKLGDFDFSYICE